MHNFFNIMLQKIRNTRHVCCTVNFSLIANDLTQAEILATEHLRIFTEPVKVEDAIKTVKRAFVLNHVIENGKAIVKNLNVFSCSGTVYVDIDYFK